MLGAALREGIAVKKCVPIIALSLSACVSADPNTQQAADDRTKQDMRSYVAANWNSFEARMRRSAPMPPGPLEFVDLDDFLCEPTAGALSCNFQITAKTQTGDLTTGRGWGMFAYHDGALGEVIIVG
jgi:hypothetical protein